MSKPSFLRSVVLFAASILLMSLAGVLMLAISIATLFNARRFCAEVIAKAVGHAVLWLAGVRLVVHQDQPFPTSQTVYAANHTSSLDLFILIALALPNTRFFMKRKFLLFPPLGLMAWLIGTFFTPPQSMPEKRIRCFQAAERALRRTGESVFLSPEGTRVTTGEIGLFNKGTFHLSTNLKAPIVPLFIDVPPKINPGKGLRARPGRCTCTSMRPSRQEPSGSKSSRRTKRRFESGSSDIWTRLEPTGRRKRLPHWAEKTPAEGGRVRRVPTDRTRPRHDGHHR